jgi:hypothetical protein
MDCQPRRCQPRKQDIPASQGNGRLTVGKRLPNPRLVKSHLPYTVEEAARVCSAHRNTVRQWIKSGLPVCDNQRPTLILGRHLRDFLQTKRTKNKRPCRPGEIYCVRCRVPRSPAGGMADYEPSSDTAGAIVGICPACETLIYRMVTLAKLDQVRGELDITIPQAHSRIGDTADPFVNSDFKAGAPTHVKTQRA